MVAITHLYTMQSAVFGKEYKQRMVKCSFQHTFLGRVFILIVELCHWFRRKNKLVVAD